MRAAPTSRPAADLRPNPAVILAGTAGAALVSFAYLPTSHAIASILLAALMIAGADVDAREYLLPDYVTGGTIVIGLVAVGLLAASEPWAEMAFAGGRAAAAAGALAFVRWGYFRVSGREGIGWGDVKLAAGIGAWLPLEAIPLCTLLAAAAALLTALGSRLIGKPIERTTQIPFGAFLCPSLWLVFFWTALS